MNLSFFTNRITISKKLAFWYGLSMFFMLSLFGYFLYETFHQAIHYNYDRHLRFEAQQLRPHIQTPGDTLTIDLTKYSRNDALKSGIQYGTFVRLYSKGGQLLYRSPNFAEVNEPLNIQLPEDRESRSISNTWREMPARTLLQPVEDRQGQLAGWLEVTGFEWTLHEEVNRFRRYLIVFIAISVLLSILGGYWLSKRALSPVSSIIDTARSITTTDLGRRIPVQYQVRDELTDLAETFNMMLNRLQKGFDREQRFTSDAAHELMTPLTSLQSEAEVILRKSRSKEEYIEAIEDMLDETRRMSEMVHLLLQLSRVESEHRPRPDIFNLSRVTEFVTQKYESKAEQHRLSLKVHVQPELFIRANDSYIEEILGNLLDNAMKYTPEGGEISFKLKKSGEKAVLHLSDSGIGFNQQTRQHLFDRFYRSNSPEVQRKSGSGLGLSLVKAIVEMYEGKIRAYSDGLGTGSTFVVELPLARQ